MRFLSALFVIALLAAACSSDNDSTAATDDDSTANSTDAFGTSTWQLTAATIDGDDLALLDSHPVTLAVVDGEVTGTAACNSYSGAVTADDGVLFGAFAVTEMACDPPEAMDLESSYLAALGEVTAATSDGTTLELTGEAVTLTFTEEAPVADAELIGTTWLLDSLVAGDDSVSSVLAGMEIDLLLAENGEISGTDGCNRFTGTYELDGDVLTVGPLAQTRRGCTDDINAQAAQVIAVLGQPITVAVAGDQLELAVDSGDGLVYRAG